MAEENTSAAEKELSLARIRRTAEQALELKIKLAEAKVAKTRVVHEKAVDELKKLYDMQKKQQRNHFITKVFCNRSLYISFN